MKVVQTFWSGRKNPLTNSYGWLNPEFNIMSWGLSCMSLREQYDGVILYTDSAGYYIFHSGTINVYIKTVYMSIKNCSTIKNKHD